MGNTDSVSKQQSQWANGPALVTYLALAKLALHLVCNGGYGYFRDELYYLACAEHLDWGYVDQPPLVALYAWFGRSVLGGSLEAIRLLPALAGAATVWLTGTLARELGGGRFAQGLAALCALVAPVYLVMHNFLSMNAFEPLFWMGATWVFIRIVKSNNPKLWVWFGVLAGLGLMNKHSTAFFGAGIVMGLLLTPARKYLANRWLWIGGLIALLIFLPNLLWQIEHNFATYELLDNVKNSTKNIALSPADYVLQQVLLFSPPTALVWLAGLGFFFVHRRGRPFRALGWTYLALLAIFIVMKGKHYYLASAYPMLFAGGAIFWEEYTALAARRWLKPALVAVLLFFGASSAPMVLPVLSPESLVGYQKLLARFGLVPKRSEASHTAVLPQHFADQFGWEEMTATVARVYHSLPPAERERAHIFANNYGEAGAVDFFGPRYDLPKAISGHQNYWLWGPGDVRVGDHLIVFGGNRRELEAVCHSVEDAAQHYHPLGIPGQNVTLYLCRGLKLDLQQVWPDLKRWL